MKLSRHLFLGLFLSTFLSSLAAMADSDLSIENIANSNQTLIGDPISYTVAVDNFGPDAVDDVSATITISRFMNLDSASVIPSQGSCTIGEEVTCSLGTIEVNETATIDYSVTTNGGGEIANTASVSAVATDSDTSNNVSGSMVHVQSLTAVQGPHPENGGCSLAVKVTKPFYGIYFLMILPLLLILKMKKKCHPERSNSL